MAITTIRGQITKTQVAIDAADRRSIAARARQRRTRFQRRAVFHWLSSEPPRRSNTKAFEMLPLCATLSHEKSMSPKSESPTRPGTCATDFRLRGGPGQHAQKTHAVYSGMYSRQESPNSGALPKPIAAALSIERSAKWPGALPGPPKRLPRSPGTPRRSARSA